MALYSDAAMVLYYDIAGDNADHDDWHTYEHMHERLSIPGFERGTRWIARTGGPTYMVIYEVAALDVATSAAYLERLNDPTPWTAAMMTRFRHMIRGFCNVAASSGSGLGTCAASTRFSVMNGRERDVRDSLGRNVLPAMSSRRGMASVHLLQPSAPPPMTKEQSIRGADTAMTWLLLATAYDPEALHETAAEYATRRELERYGASMVEDTAIYRLHYTVTAREVTRTPPNAVLPAHLRAARGLRR
jgi:hypothetical protein